MQNKQNNVKASLLFQKIRDEFVFFSGSMLLTWLVSTYVVARILGPLLYGEWTIILLILMYGHFVHSGLFQALSRNIPYSNGEGDVEEVARIRDTSFWTLSFVYSAVAVISVIVCVYGVKIAVPESTLWLVAALLYANGLFEFVTRYYTAQGQFKAVGILNSLVLIVISCSITPLVNRYAMNGVLLTFLAGRIISITITSWYAPLAIHGAFSWKTLRSLYTTGFPLFVSDVLALFFISVDRLYIALLLGKLMVSYFGIASMCGTILVIFGESFGKMMNVYIAQSSGEHHLDGPFRASMKAASRGAGWMFSVVSVVVCALIPWFIRWQLPAYEVSILPSQIIVLGTGIFCLYYIPRYYFFAQQKLIPYLSVMGIACMAKVMVLLYLCLHHASLVSIAYAMSIISACVAVFMLGVLYRMLFRSFGKIVYALSTTGLPYMVLYGAYVLVLVM